jgi:alpha-amylase
VESIHELVQAREPGLEARLFYDAYERRSGLVHLFDVAVSADELMSGSALEHADIVDAPYELAELDRDRLVARRDALAHGSDAPQAIRVQKTYRLAGDRRSPRLALSVRLENRSDRVLAGRLALEWNVTFLGGGGNPAAFYQVDGERRPHDTEGRRPDTSRLLSGNTDIGLLLTTDIAPPAEAWWYPIDTISNSETGFERVYQGSSLVLSWPVDLASGEHLEVEVRQALDASRDRAAEEAVNEGAATEAANATAAPPQARANRPSRPIAVRASPPTRRGRA